MAHSGDDGRESAAAGDGQVSGGSAELSQSVLGTREVDGSESLVTVVVAFNFLGDGIRDWLDPRSR